MSSRRSRRKFKNCAGKKAKSYPGAGWNRTRTKAREVSRGGVSSRGGPRCPKLPLCIQGCSLWSEVKAIWISANGDLHGSEMHVILFREASKTEVGIEAEVEGREVVGRFSLLDVCSCEMLCTGVSSALNGVSNQIDDSRRALSQE